MDSSPKEKLICISCGYETDYQGTYAKPPLCPKCKNFLSFKDSGAVGSEDTEMSPWVRRALLGAGILSLLLIFGLMFRHFHTFDSRALIREEVRTGEAFFGGPSRSKISAEWESMPYSFERYWAHNFRGSRTSIMIREEHSYVYQGGRGGQIQIEYRYSDSTGKKGARTLSLNLNANAAFLDIPQLPYVQNSSPARLKLVPDASGSRLRVSKA